MKGEDSASFIMSPRRFPHLANMTPTESTVSSGWSIIRNAIDYRMKGT